MFGYSIELPNGNKTLDRSNALQCSLKTDSSHVYTLNVDIFACMHFREFKKLVNFACILNSRC